MVASKNSWTHFGYFKNKKTGEHFGDYGNPGILQRPTLFQPKSPKGTTPIINIFQFTQFPSSFYPKYRQIPKPLSLVTINGNPGRPRSKSKTSQPDSTSNNQGMYITGCWA